VAVDPAKVYDGKPCPRCGETLRWRSNSHCVECVRANTRTRLRRRYHDDSAYRDGQKARVAERNERLYWGDGTESFLYRAKRGLNSRRQKALERIAEREATRKEP
jgi:hypothetical protein